MKLAIKLILILAITTNLTLTKKDPIYEAPMITKRDFPFDQPYNPRIDNLNDSSENNYQRYLSRRRKGHVNSELARGFNINSLSEFLDSYETERLE